MKTRPGADCETDHAPLVSKIRLKLRKLKSAKISTKLDLALLQQDQDLKRNFSITAKNKFQTLAHLESAKDQWEALK